MNFGLKRILKYSMMIGMIGSAQAELSSPAMVVDSNTNRLLGIEDVVIGEEIYNVGFHSGHFHDVYCNSDPACSGGFTPYSGAFSVAASETLTDLFTTGGIFDGSTYDLHPTFIEGCENASSACLLLTPSIGRVSNNYLVYGGFGFLNYNLNGEILDKRFGTNGGTVIQYSNLPNISWLTWDKVGTVPTSPVPLPPTALLLGSSLIALLTLGKCNSGKV